MTQQYQRQIFTGPRRVAREDGHPAPARLGYDSFQLLSSATAHDVRKPEPNFKRSRSRADAWRLVRPQSA
jgi:hypothetical protein